MMKFVCGHSGHSSSRYRYKFLLSRAYIQAKYFFFVYSTTSRSSFDEIAALDDKSSAEVPMVLIANKSDLEGKRQVSASEDQELAELFDCL
mmetsp:Transcript_21255/g.26979  ORF Transcript_21255/g.26979 Transcript_21255/m.26979 type:complete len:91 (+) Transcript_21255:189-461(+)